MGTTRAWVMHALGARRWLCWLLSCVVQWWCGKVSCVVQWSCGKLWSIVCWGCLFWWGWGRLGAGGAALSPALEKGQRLGGEAGSQLFVCSLALYIGRAAWCALQATCCMTARRRRVLARHGGRAHIAHIAHIAHTAQCMLVFVTDAHLCCSHALDATPRVVVCIGH